ncbi:MAG: DMT family transporter [Gammaproteobacteria bacterium]|nr:DMT family transporter [Gammaproteobacteria bacterium]
MSTVAPTADVPVSRTPQGIAAIILGMLLFVCQDAMMKSLLGDFPVWPLLLVRAVVCSLVMVPLILYFGPPHRILTPLWPLHVARAMLFAFGFSLYYAAFPFMTLAAVTTIFFAAPLLTAVFAAVFLKEHIGIHRISALVLGFVGVMVAMKPGADSFQWVSVLPLICAFSYATSQMLARRIGDRDTAMVAGAYTIILAGLFVLPLGWALNALFDIGAEAAHLRWSWQAFSVGILPWLVLLGAIGMVGWTLLSRAYQVADVGAVAPFEYAYLPLAAALGYLAFDEVPTWNTLVGMALIIVSGVYIGYREVVNARRSIMPTAEASFAPGNPAVVHEFPEADQSTER